MGSREYKPKQRFFSIQILSSFFKGGVIFGGVIMKMNLDLCSFCYIPSPISWHEMDLDKPCSSQLPTVKLMSSPRCILVKNFVRQEELELWKWLSLGSQFSP